MAINTADYCLCLEYCFETQGKQKHHRRGNSPRACRHPQSHLNKAQMGTPQTSLIWCRERSVWNQCPKGKRTGLECCYCWFCLQVIYKILDLEGTLKRLSFWVPSFSPLDRTHTPHRGFYLKSFPKMLLCSPWTSPPPAWLSPTLGPSFLDTLSNAFSQYISPPSNNNP